MTVTICFRCSIVKFRNIFYFIQLIRKRTLTIRIAHIATLLFFLIPLEAQVDYNSQIQPIFNNHCINCHGNMGGLNLTSYDNLMQGGLSGDEVIPYDYESSELWQRINSGQMPPGNNDLSDTQVNLIAQWINEGANHNYSMGDINSDGIVNILDVIGLINIILGLSNENPFGDLNNDNVYNILDVVLLVNYILD